MYNNPTDRIEQLEEELAEKNEEIKAYQTRNQNLVEQKRAREQQIDKLNKELEETNKTIKEKLLKENKELCIDIDKYQSELYNLKLSNKRLQDNENFYINESKNLNEIITKQREKLTDTLSNTNKNQIEITVKTNLDDEMIKASTLLKTIQEIKEKTEEQNPTDKEIINKLIEELLIKDKTIQEIKEKLKDI